VSVVSSLGTPAIEKVVPFTFTRADRRGRPDEPEWTHRHMDQVYGGIADPSWLERGTLIDFHDMVRVVAWEMAADLAGVDLLITVDASPDCRYQSFPACLLADLIPGEPKVLGVSDQGVAGPFTALRIAGQHLADGACRRAVVLILEQRTVPPDERAVRPAHDVAVALLVGRGGGMQLGPVDITVTGRGDAGLHSGVSDLAGVDAVALGAALADMAAPEGTPVARADGSHPCAGVWLALSRLVGGAVPAGPGRPGRVLVADRDPVLPYACRVILTASGPRLAGIPVHIRARERILV
jgi:hypothetical protein